MAECCPGIGKEPLIQIAVAPLSRYLDEQAFRYNNRKMNDGERFDIMVRQIVGRSSVGG